MFKPSFRFGFWTRLIAILSLSVCYCSSSNLDVETATENEDTQPFSENSIDSILHRQQQLDLRQCKHLESQVDELSRSVRQIASKLGVEPPGKTLYYAFSVSYIKGSPDGVKARKILAVDGQFPGPAIVGKVGDTVKVRVSNNIGAGGEDVTIHWHGLFQNGSQFEDGTELVTQCGIPPGESMTYTFKLMQSGTYWWHSHVVYQYTEGLFGPIIIHNSDPIEPDPINHDLDPYTPLYDPENEILLLLSDWNHKPGSEIAKWYMSHDSKGNEPVPDSILINGRGSYPCKVAEKYGLTCQSDKVKPWKFWVTKGETYRFRVINAGGFVSFNVSIDGHKLMVIEADGTLVRSNFKMEYESESGHEGQMVDAFTIHPGQRLSFLVTMTAPVSTSTSTSKSDENLEPGQFAIRSRVRSDYFPDEGPDIGTSLNGSALIQETFAILQYENGDEMQRKLNTPFQYLSEDPYDVNPGSFGKMSEKKPDDKNADTVYLDESHLSSVDGPAPDPMPASEILKITLFIKQSEEDLRKGKGFYLNFNNISFDLSHEGKTGKPLLARVLANETLPPEAHPIYLNKRGQVIQILINNFDYGPHPIHLHGHNFWVLGQGPPKKGEFDPKKHGPLLDLNGVKRDTAFVDAASWVVIRFVSDNPGVWLVHCHMQWHSMGGLKLTLVEGAEELRKKVKRAPKEVRRICRLKNVYL